MKYIVCAPVDPDFEKIVKNIRYQYDRNLVSDPVILVIAQDEGEYGEMRQVMAQVEYSLKGINAIKINLDYTEKLGSLLIYHITENQKISRYKHSLFSKGNFFINKDEAPYIPIINIFEEEYYEEIFEYVNMECRNTEFFLRKIALFMEKNNGKMEPLAEFEI